MGEQSHDARDSFDCSPESVEGSSHRRREGLLTLRAPIALVLATMNPDVALSGLASSRTVQVGAKYFVRVQVVCSFGFFLVKDPKASAMNPLIVKNMPYTL